jgi:hypothetical protein
MPSNQKMQMIWLRNVAFAACLAASFSADFADAKMQNANLPCLPVAEMNKFLKEEYGEDPLIITMAPTVSYVLYVKQDPNRSWTSVGVSNGIACLVSNGDMWQTNNELIIWRNKQKK